jgi:hypothetical protein
MKMFNTIIVVLCLGFACLPQVALTQSSGPFPVTPTPCDQDCLPAVPFQQGSWQYTDGNGCVVTVYYAWRITCGAYELKIVGATTVGNCPGEAGQIMNDAIGLMVRGNGMNFQPNAQSNPGSWWWRVTRPGCWSRSTNGQTITSCTSECCVTTIGLMKKPGCAEIQIVSENSQIPKDRCPGGSLSSVECKYGCNEFFTPMGPKGGVR